MRLVAFLVAVSFAGFAPASSAPAEPVLQLTPGETLLEVEAEGEVFTRPDMMQITAGVVTTGATSAEALRANAELAGRLIAAARASGIEPSDIETTRLELDPKINDAEKEKAEEEGRPPRILGYIARNQLNMRFRDLRRASEIMDRLFQAGANEVRGPHFSLQDPLPAQRLAEREAIRQARLQADNYAAAMGKKVARILRVSERRSWVDEDSNSIMVTGSRLYTPIEPGEIESSVTVWVDFALVPDS